MANRCITRCTKFFLGTVNIVQMLGSFFVFCIGIWILVDENAFSKLAKFRNSAINDENKEALKVFLGHVDITLFGYVLIIASAIVFMVSLIGLCGTLFGFRRLIIAYLVVIFVANLILVAGGALTTVYKSEAENTAKDILKYTIKEEYGASRNKISAITLLWDVIMTKKRCCGVESYKDFRDSHFSNLNLQNVPQACCKLSSVDGLSAKIADSSCPYQPTERNSYMNHGCFDKIKKWLDKRILVLSGIMVVCVGAQIIILVYVTSLFISTRKDQKYQEWSTSKKSFQDYCQFRRNSRSSVDMSDKSFHFNKR